jgi:hypothetical protein
MSDKAMTPSLWDRLAEASAAPRAEDVEACLQEAMRLATSCFEWRTVLRGGSALPLRTAAQLREIAARTVERAAAEQDVWGFRGVAALYVGPLADDQAARAVLQRAVDELGVVRPELVGGAAGTRGYQWVLLAQGVDALLADRAGLQRCLQLGPGRCAARAQGQGDDLCGVATAWAQHVDEAAGRTLLLVVLRLLHGGDDPRLDELCQRLAEWTTSDLGELRGSMRATLWRELAVRVLAQAEPLRPRGRELAEGLLREV